ncbi:MAG: DUF192 domain-containing protein [Acidimicrobiales bacterium]
MRWAKTQIEPATPFLEAGTSGEEAMRSGWLIRDCEVLASAELADGYLDRVRGLIGRRDFEGAMVLPRTRSVHTAFVPFVIDVAFLDREFVVVSMIRMARWKISLPRRRGCNVLEAPSGSFERWRLHVGDRLEFRDATQ